MSRPFPFLAIAVAMVLTACNTKTETEVLVLGSGFGKEAGVYGESARVFCEINVEVKNKATTALNRISFHLTADDKQSSPVSMSLRACPETP